MLWQFKADVGILQFFFGLLKYLIDLDIFTAFLSHG